ncbi:MAG: phosphoribosyltransferase domain-containing protein [Bacillota bacterium]|nr:phosphoribosyltransferase domain-containing protein [Bacillota bacterium]
MPSYTTSYTKETTLRVAKRYRNAKRAYLLVNPLQAKHMPVSPTEALTMMRTLGEGLRQEFSGARLVLGFAETATALGAAVASRLGPDCAFLTTTREAGEGPGWVRFLEEHSHAAEQKLWGGDLDALLQETDTVLFVDDEISTGKTLRNMVAQLTRRWPALGEKTLVAASLLNRVTPEQEEALADAGITCRCLVRLPQEDHTAQVADWTVTEAPPAVPQNLSFRQETLPGEGLLDPRKTLRIGAYDSSCQAVAEAMLSHTLGPVETMGKTLVLGTEECMYPALRLGERLERLGAEVCCHATTRSPIGLCDAPGYPIRSGWKLPSFYEEERTTYVYNLREYDTVIVLSDTKKTDLRAIQALASVLTCKQLIYTQGEGYVWKLSKG